MSNRFSRIVQKIEKTPAFIRPFLLTRMFCSQVKYAGTSGIKIQMISNEKVVIKLANTKRVQNHIGGIHAVAAALLAESTTGILLGMNVPDDRVPLLKSMKIDYQRRMQGDLLAVATLSSQQKAFIEQHEKGDMVIEVEISDESEQAPIACEMVWAWVLKRK